MVTTNNLSRVEATARAAAVSVASYSVALDLTGDDATFRSVTEVNFTARTAGGSASGREAFIEVAAVSVAEVLLNGVSLEGAFDAATGRVLLTGLAESNTVSIDATMSYSHTGEGLHRFVDPADGLVYLYTQFETYDAHRMFACFDQPDLKASFSFEVTAPASWTVVSNSPVVSVTPSGDAATTVFEPTPVMSTYITALVAGPYHSVHTVHDGIELGLFCRQSLAEHLDADELFLITGQGFDFYHRVFDYRYPFGKYDQLFVPEFNAGAMENAGCVTYRDEMLPRAKVTDATYERRAETILHEMAHMWFGDLVTMRWWDDLWLNESFATYMSVLALTSATRWTNGWTTFANTEKTWALLQDQLPSTHPIAADASDMEAVRDNFDGITYAKGASVLKQLVAWVGQGEFLAGLRSYFRAYEFSNTSLADLLRELERSSGRDLSGWSAQWLETTGVNTLRPLPETDSSGLYTAFTVEQSAAPGHPTLREHRIAIGLYDSVDGALVRRDRLELDIAGPATEVTKLVGVRAPDLLLLNDDDLTFAKIRLDPRSLETVIGSIGTITASLPRAMCWNAAWDMLRDAELGSGAYLSLVLSGLPAEAGGDIGLLSSILSQAWASIVRYGRPDARRERLASLAAACLSLLEAAEPGSDQQLVFAQNHARSAVGEEAVERLRGWLAGTGVPHGLAVDSELRWALLIRLVSLGEAGEAEIAAELARDNTAAGARSATTARASLPTAEAKEAAWLAALTDESLSNRLLTATLSGFVSFEKPELLSPYVSRYFQALPTIYAERGHETAQTIATMLYPSYIGSPEVIEATDAHLATLPAAAEGATASGLRRLLAEGRDGVARALRVQAADV